MFDSLNDMVFQKFGSLPFYSNAMLDIAVKSISNLSRSEYNNIMCSISGGSDSDILIDLVEKCRQPNNKIYYVFFNTGLEYKATLNHLDYLRDKYNVYIQEVRPKTPIPVACKKFGVPFRNKRISNYIARLQKHNFKFEDKPFEKLYKEYPQCKAALRWWCNDFGGRFDIAYTKGLKEYMIEFPPTFKISDQCCVESKKKVAHSFISSNNIDLNIYGVRKSEGGARATSYKSCFNTGKTCDEFRPLFYMDNDLKFLYELTYNIGHSDCYTCYGLKRTGCAGCPFGKNYRHELDIISEFEPTLFKACWSIFGDSYIYDKTFELFRR